MKIWLLKQHCNELYDTYDSCVVSAENEASARLINPNCLGWKSKRKEWANSPELVVVKLLGEGEFEEEGLILASFNAG
jgi:hypothetical protein